MYKSNILNDLMSNYRAGLRLVSFRPCQASDFKINADQLALLLLLDLSSTIVADYLSVAPNPEFDIYALPVYAFDQICLFGIFFLLSKISADASTFMRLGVMVYSVSPLLIALNCLTDFPDNHPDIMSAETLPWFKPAVSLLIIGLLYRAFHVGCAGIKRHSLAGMLAVLIVSAASYDYYNDYKRFWYPETKGQDSNGQDPYAAYRNLDAEALMYRQPEILGNSLAKLSSAHRRKTDIYFVGFAGFASEDVFSKEVAYARRLFDERFDTQGHSINLINHLNTLESQPLATATNLGLTLKRIGEIMSEEDILFLYLTSHGSQDHQLTVSFWPLALNNITPERLNAMLDQAGIKWRVIVVSSCYSGGFVDSLQGPATLVATAAAADKTSFGCGNGFDFTYFGEALFKEQLQHQTSFVTALRLAAVSIGERERRENIAASEPQLFVGADMENKLRQLERQNCNFVAPGIAGC